MDAKVASDAIFDEIGNSFFSDQRKKLVVILGPLGDFDSFEYVQALVEQYSFIKSKGIDIKIIGIGGDNGKRKFCNYTKLFPDDLVVQTGNNLHNSIGLSAGPELPFNSGLRLLCMCAGVGSPGTLAEVLRGYLGDKNSLQKFSNDSKIKIGFLPAISGSLFSCLGGQGFQRPFELATFRLQNMIEILYNWNDYMPKGINLTQRGGTFLFDSNKKLLYSYRPTSLLSFSETMHNPLMFLDSYI